MNLVNELENDIALAFLVEKKHSERLNSTDIVQLMDQVREILRPLSDDDLKNHPDLAAGIVSGVSAN